MSDTKQKVSVYVEKEHLSRAKAAGYTSPTAAVNKGLELLMDIITEDEERTKSGRMADNVGYTADSIGHVADFVVDNAGHTAGNIGRVEDVVADNVGRTADNSGRLADSVGSVEDAIENASLRARVEEKDKQISDKNTEIEFLKGQITIKDQQIDKRDADIKNLVAITTTQTYKAIEAPGAKKPWWRFW
jgi:hypothetical protein